jgi:hypothetical protein
MAGGAASDSMPVRFSPTSSVLAVALLLAGVALLVTWPLAAHLGDALPGNLGDPLLNAWTLGWGSDRLRHGLQGFWDGRAFHPHRDTVAFSEHLLGITAFVAPVYWATKNAVLTYNVAYLASFVHAGLGAWLLVRRLTGRGDVALIAALAFAFPLLRTSGQHTFLHMQVSGWVPICFWALHRYADRPRLLDALLAAGAFTLAVLTSLYFAFVLLVPLAYAAVVLVRRNPDLRRPVVVGHLAAAAALVAAILAPVLLRYQGVAALHAFERTSAESVRYSADVLSYLSVWHQADLRPFLREETTVVRALFPGLVIALVAAAAVWRRAEPVIDGVTLWRWGAPAAGIALAAATWFGASATIGTAGLALLAAGVCLPLPATTPGLYARLAVLAFLLSLGPVPAAAGTPIASSGPHAWAIEILPGASGLRMPARHGLMVSFALAVLCGFGAARLLARPALARRAGLALAGLGALVVADGYAGPLPLAPFDAMGTEEARRVHGWIASRGPGAVMHLPIADADFGQAEVANASVQLTFHYATLLHGQPTVTGGTDFMPLLGRWLHGEGSPFRSPPDADAALEALRRLGVRYVLLHRDEFRSTGDAEAYEGVILRAGRHVRDRRAFTTIHAIELREPLPRLATSAPPPERGPPHRVRCRYLDAGAPAPSGPLPEPSSASIAATWECPLPAGLPGGPLQAARWTFDLQRQDTWPSRLRADTGDAAAPIVDLTLAPLLADAMVTRPAGAPQIETPLSTTTAATVLRVRTWGARAPRSTPPFWLEVWSDGR